MSQRLRESTDMAQSQRARPLSVFGLGCVHVADWESVCARGALCSESLANRGARLRTPRTWLASDLEVRLQFVPLAAVHECAGSSKFSW